MRSETPRILGRGIYTIRDAARYTRLPYQRISRWFRSAEAMQWSPVFMSDYGSIDSENAISFLDLVDVHVAGRFRGRGVSLQKIRKAYNILREDLETEHPFCHRNLYEHGGDIFAKVFDAIGGPMLYEVIKRQGFSQEAMREHLTRIDYADTTLLAERWRIFPGVVIDPCITLGRPVIESTGLATRVLASGYHGNDQDETFVASFYEVTPADVLTAVHFEEKYGKAA